MIIIFLIVGYISFAFGVKLVCGGFIIRKQTPKIKEFNETWWKEVKNYSYRDQISSSYAIYKSKLNYSIITFAADNLSSS